MLSCEILDCSVVDSLDLVSRKILVSVLTPKAGRSRRFARETLRGNIDRNVAIAGLKLRPLLIDSEIDRPEPQDAPAHVFIHLRGEVFIGIFEKLSSVGVARG